MERVRLKQLHCSNQSNMSHVCSARWRAVFSLCAHRAHATESPGSGYLLKMAATQKSSSWDYFIKVDAKTVKCKVCDKKYAYHSSTTVMTTAYSNAEKHDRFHRQTPKLWWSQITELITRMIGEDTLPISFVETKGFRRLMAFVEPEYTDPCRTTIMMRLEDKYKESAASLRMDLSKASSVSLTTDAWTGLATVSYPRMWRGCGAYTVQFGYPTVATQVGKKKRKSRSICRLVASTCRLAK